MLAPLKFRSEGREFEVTLNGEPVFFPTGSYRTKDDSCCPWFAGEAGFYAACASCKAGYG